jgi:hypothetical protein
MISPATITAPTAGLGNVVPFAVSARESAVSMNGFPGCLIKYESFQMRNDKEIKLPITESDL